MIESARGVILRTQRLTETSLIVRWLTQEQGRIATVARGARRPKSAFAGKLDLFLEADFTFSRSRRSDLHTLRELSVTDFHLPLRDDVGRLQVASHATALIEQTTESETPLPGLYELLTGLLRALCSGPARPRLVFAFELKLLAALGLAPDLSRARLSPAAARLANTLSETDWPGLEGLQAETTAVKQLNAFLHGFLIYHLGRIPRTRGAALGRKG